MEDNHRHIALALILGVVVGLLCAQFLPKPVAPAPFDDADGDTIADASDLRPDGDALLMFVVGQIQHDEVNHTRNVTLVLGYNDDGRSDGTLSGQSCALNLTLAANTTISHPAGVCKFQVDDYAHRSVSFEYRMFHVIESGPERAEVAWDIFAGHDDDAPWGVNATVDPAALGAGDRVILNGLGDGDAWEHNARVEFITSTVVADE